MAADLQHGLTGPLRRTCTNRTRGTGGTGRTNRTGGTLKWISSKRISREKGITIILPLIRGSAAARVFGAPGTLLGVIGTAGMLAWHLSTTV